jgi:hypothetical protein
MIENMRPLPELMSESGRLFFLLHFILQLTA